MCIDHLLVKLGLHPQQFYNVLGARFEYVLSTVIDDLVDRIDAMVDFQEILERELQICKDAASGCGRISLEFERVVFTETGTLLLTWTDSTGNIERLRAGFRTHFPGLHHSYKVR